MPDYSQVFEALGVDPKTVSADERDRLDEIINFNLQEHRSDDENDFAKGLVEDAQRNKQTPQELFKNVLQNYETPGHGLPLSKRGTPEEEGGEEGSGEDAETEASPQRQMYQKALESYLSSPEGQEPAVPTTQPQAPMDNGQGEYANWLEEAKKRQPQLVFPTQGGMKR